MELARQLLDSEFESFDNNPNGYAESLGWNKNVSELKGQLCPVKEDFEKLNKIIQKIYEQNPDATTEDVIENNSVSDFLCNCVATKIVAIFKN